VAEAEAEAAAAAAAAAAVEEEEEEEEEEAKVHYERRDNGPCLRLVVPRGAVKAIAHEQAIVIVWPHLRRAVAYGPVSSGSVDVLVSQIILGLRWRRLWTQRMTRRMCTGTLGLGFRV